MKRKAPNVPATMTGGVDLTDAPLVPSNPDSLERLNAQPDVIQTLTASGRNVPGLTPSTNIPGGNPDNNPKDDEDPYVERGLHDVVTRYQGEPVRVIPASRMRTQRLRVLAGTQMALARPDSRRIRAVVMFTSNTATDVCFISNDQTTAVAMGFALPINVPVELRNGDEIGIAVDAANVGTNQFISIIQEIQE